MGDRGLGGWMAAELEQGADAGPGDLHADAKDKKGAEPVDDLFASWAKTVDKPGGIGVTDIDENADQQDGDKKRAEVENVVEDIGLVFVGREGQDDGDGAGARRHRKGNGVEKEGLDIPGAADGLGRFLFSLYLVGGEQLPAHATNKDAPRQLYDGDGNAK